MTLSLTWIANAVDGPLRGSDQPVTGAAIDSRRVKPGDLFIAVAGEQVDGHDFLDDARARGAAGALVSRSVACNLPQIVCADVPAALSAAAAAWRAYLNPTVVGITGSCGKTTVKELVAAILSEAGPCLVTEGNYNNELGVPITLLHLNESHRFAVIEMGASRRGDIAYLAKMARPDIGLVTNAAAAHIEYFGDLETVAETKGEMFAELPQDGVAVINADDNFSGLWRGLAGNRRQVTFSSTTDGDVTGTRSDHALQIRTPAGDFDCAFALPGVHNLANALSACAVSWVAGVSIQQMAAGLAKVSLPKGRLTRYRMRGDWVLIDDSYNANPTSLRAAVEVLVSASADGWLVLGDMGELGPEAEALHFACGRDAREQGVARLMTLGPLSAHAAKGFGDLATRFDSHDAIAKQIRRDVQPSAAVLVKGSRSAAMEKVVDALLDDPGALEEAA